MGIGSITGSSSDVSTVRDTFDQFRKGQASLSKDDLTKISAELSADGKSTTRIDNLLQNYDTIDLNGNGISVDELQTYRKSQGSGGGSGDDEQKTLTKDDLVALRNKITQATGQSPDGLDKIISNFDQVDADKNGSVSKDELQQYAQANGIQLPKGGGHHHHGHHHRGGQTDSSVSTQTVSEQISIVELQATITDNTDPSQNPATTAAQKYTDGITASSNADPSLVPSLPGVQA